MHHNGFGIVKLFNSIMLLANGQVMSKWRRGRGGVDDFLVGDEDEQIKHYFNLHYCFSNTEQILLKMSFVKSFLSMLYFGTNYDWNFQIHFIFLYIFFFLVWKFMINHSLRLHLNEKVWGVHNNNPPNLFEFKGFADVFEMHILIFSYIFWANTILS